MNEDESAMEANMASSAPLSQDDQYDASYDEDGQAEPGALGQVQAAHYGEGYPSYGGGGEMPKVSSEDVRRADQHMQDVIDDLIKRQRSFNSRNDPSQGISKAAQMALLSGFGGGSFGQGAATGLARAAPLVQKQEQLYQQGQQGIENLRLKAANDESMRLRDYMRANSYDRWHQGQVQASLIRNGYRLDESGRPVPDPMAMDVLRQKAEMVERGKLKAQGLDSLTTITNGEDAPTINSASEPMSHAQAIMMAESSGNINVKPGDGGKAIGPMQLHKDAAEEVGVTDRNDPDQNIAGGKAYLDKYTNVYAKQGKENPALWATVAYKNGPGYAAKWDGDINSLSPAAQKYVQSVNKYMKHGLLNDEVIPGLDDKIAASNVPADIAPRIQAMIEGRGKPLTGYGSNSPYGRKLTALINQIDPTYDEHRYKTIEDFDTGATSKIIRPINTSIAHLDTLESYAEALNNGDTQIINKFKNSVAAQLGSVPPSSFEAIKPIVANEVVKAIVARGGTEADRHDAQKALSEAKSLPQLKGVVTAEKSLLAGQMNSMEQTYKAGTNGLNNFKQKYLTPATRAALRPGPKFPMTLRNAKGKVATVISDDELAEAQGEGYQ